jgi:hypothetical protein
MKSRLFPALLLGSLLFFTSCNFMSKLASPFHKLFGPKYGCPSNGKNVGAEKILSGDPQATKDAKKAKRFKY